MTLDIHNWSSSVHQEIHKIVKDEIFPIVNQVDARLQNFEIQFLKEAAKFVRDFKSLAKEADESLAKHKALELEIERLLRAVVSQDIMSIVQSLPKIDETHALSKLVTSNSVPTPQESKFMKNDNVIAPGIFRINYFKPSSAKKGVNSNLNGLSSIRVDNTAKTRRPQPRINTKNDRVPSMSKSSSIKNKVVEVEEQHRNLLLSKNKKHMSSECNNVKLAIRNDKSEVVCSMYSRCSKHMTGNLQLLINFVWKFLGTVRFGNDHVAAILGYGDIQWGNILITRVFFVEGLGHNLFSVGRFCDSDLEVAFKRNTCFIKNLEGVDLLKGRRTTNLYTINLHDMASASLIFLMARATSTSHGYGINRALHLKHCLQSFTVDLTKLHMILLMAENQISPFFMYSGLSVIPKMIVKTLGNLVEKVTLAFSLVILLIAVLTEFTTEKEQSEIQDRMNVTFDELSAMDFEQRSSKPGLQSMTFGKISSGLDLTYAPSTITTQQPTENELDLLFEAMYDDYIGGHHHCSKKSFGCSSTSCSSDSNGIYNNSRHHTDTNKFILSS
ncbi:hypothetical protein Tco_0613863 [Tanacetum coccineum]